jgi:hypothetical protein
MNMFRNLLCLFLIALGTSLIVSNPTDWPIIQRMGPDVLNVFKVCETFRPFVIGACYVVAIALFMTRKIY